MLFEHQGYLMQGLRRLYLFIAIKLPRVKDLLHDPPFNAHTVINGQNNWDLYHIPSAV